MFAEDAMRAAEDFPKYVFERMRETKSPGIVSSTLDSKTVLGMETWATCSHQKRQNGEENAGCRSSPRRGVTELVSEPAGDMSEG